MILEDRLVTLARLGLEVRRRGDPLVGPLAERVPPTLRVNPVVTSQVGFDGGGIPLGIGLASKVLLSLLLVWAAVVHLPPDLALAGCLLVDAGHGCSSLLVLTVFASCDTNAWLPLAFDAPLGDPVGDVLLVEANELSDLVIRHAVLFDESSYEPFGNAEACLLYTSDAADE